MADIVYRFTSIGHDDIKRHFRNIADEALKMRTSVVAANKATERKASTGVDRALVQSVRVHERAEDAKTRSTVRNLDQRTRAAERQAQAQARIEQRRAEQFMREQNRMHERAERSMRASVDRTMRVANKAASFVASNVAQLVGSAFSDRMQVSDTARRLSINSRGAGEKFASASSLQMSAESVARNVRGVKAQDILEAQQRYVAMTGDLGTARKLGGMFGTASMATGGKAEDMAATAATISQKFGIKDAAGMKTAMSSLIFQGKNGAFEMADMAQYASKMGAAGARFGLDKGAGGVATLGGLAQLARSSTGSGAEAATSVQAMLSMLETKAGKIKAATGADVFADRGKTKTNAIGDVLTKTIGGAHGNLETLTKIFGERGIRAVSPLIEAFNQAQHAVRKGATEAEKRAAGEAAVRRALEGAIGTTSQWSEVEKDAAEAAKSSSAILTAAWERMASGIMSGVEPSIEALGQHMGLVDTVAQGLGEAFAIAVDAVTEFSKFLESKGFLKKTEAPSVEEAASKKGHNNARLDELASLESKGKLSARQKAERYRLQQSNIELDQQLGTNDLSKPIPMTPKGAYGSLGYRNPFAGTPGLDAMLLPGGERKPGGGDIDYSKHAISSGIETPSRLALAGGAFARKVMDPAGIFQGAANYVTGSNKADAEHERSAHALGAAAKELSAAAKNMQKQGNPLGFGDGWFQ